MKPLCMLRNQAENDKSSRDMLLVFPNGICRNASWLDPYLGLLKFEELPDAMVYMGDLPLGTVGLYLKGD